MTLRISQTQISTDISLNPIRGGLLWSGVEAGGGADSAPPLLFLNHLCK